MKQCPTCGGERDRPGQAYCRKCHNAYKRRTRPTYQQLAPDEQRKSRVRAYANVNQRRGVLVPQPCERCGSTNPIQKHHPDYERPLTVVWLCRGCHAAEHGREALQDDLL
jgi:hypothetical protein